MRKIYFTIAICGLMFATNLNAQTWQIGNPIASNVVATLSNDTLTISGTGAMKDWVDLSYFFEWPWSDIITVVVIEYGVTTIGNAAFRHLERLTCVTIPNSVTSIGDNAFDFCRSLTSVDIPNSVKSIGNMAFAYCDNLTSVTIGNNVVSIGDNAFFGCHRLTSVNIPNSVVSIGSGAFSDCFALTSIIISNSVTYIGFWAFAGCRSLTSVIIGSGITDMGREQFAGNINLSSITVLSAVPPSISWDVFTGVDKQNCCLYVLPTSIDLYRMANIWGEFECIKRIPGFYAVTFNSQGGSDMSPQSVEQGKKITEPTPPIRTNYIFGGWYKDITYTNTWDFATDVVTSDITLYAKWNANQTSITDILSADQIQIYPNPVSHQLRIINYDFQQGDIVELFDMNGRRVFSQRVNTHIGEFTIDMSAFQQGNYILRVGNRVAKVVKQ